MSVLQNAILSMVTIDVMYDRTFELLLSQSNNYLGGSLHHELVEVLHLLHLILPSH